MAKRADIVAAARKYAGVKWQHQGRTLHGIDCAGIVVCAGKDSGIVDYNPMNYPARPDGSFLFHFDAALTRKPITSMLDGDVLVFTESTVECHCGIKTTINGEPGVIHSHLRRGFVIEETLESAKSVCGRPVRCYQYPNIED